VGVLLRDPLNHDGIEESPEGSQHRNRQEALIHELPGPPRTHGKPSSDLH